MEVDGENDDDYDKCMDGWMLHQRKRIALKLKKMKNEMSGMYLSPSCDLWSK